MTGRLSPQREAEIQAWLGRLGEKANPDWHGPHTAVQELLAELAAVRAERDQLQKSFDELETLGRELLSHCTAEYGGPGYTHCELPTGHGGQHESALGHMRRATWGGEAR